MLRERLQMKENLDKIGKFEIEISKKYGESAIKNPNSDWSPEKEKIFQEEQKRLLEKEQKHSVQEEKVELDGFYVPEKLLNRQSKTDSCPVCNKFITKIRDEIYLLKMECCYRCYVEHVEHREDRWKSGWRPSK